MNDNTIIALFMGLKPHPQDSDYLIDERKDVGYEKIHVECMLYESSWDWLMPVILTIEGGGLDPHELIDKALESRLIEDVYNEVVDTIKRCNEKERLFKLYDIQEQCIKKDLNPKENMAQHIQEVLGEFLKATKKKTADYQAQMIDGDQHNTSYYRTAYYQALAYERGVRDVLNLLEIKTKT